MPCNLWYVTFDLLPFYGYSFWISRKIIFKSQFWITCILFIWYDTYRFCVCLFTWVECFCRSISNYRIVSPIADFIIRLRFSRFFRNDFRENNLDLSKSQQDFRNRFGNHQKEQRSLYEEAEKSKRFYGLQQENSLFAAMKTISVSIHHPENVSIPRSKNVWNVFRQPNFYKPLRVGCVLMIIQQFSGIRNDLICDQSWSFAI